MSSGVLLEIEPLELKFPLESKKLISCSLHLSNKIDENVAFKVKTTNPKKYCVRPNTGVVPPRSTCDVLVTMQNLKDFPTDLQCKDKFLVQSVSLSGGPSTPSAKDITAEMFSKESGNIVEECKLRVVYLTPPQPPSPVPEGSDEDTSPRPSQFDNHGARASSHLASRSFAETQDKSSDASAIISKLTYEKNRSVEENKNLHQELEMLRREASNRRGGFSLMFVVVMAIVGIILGYILKK